MLSLVVRLTTACACALLALIASFQIEMVESAIPPGAERTLELSVASSSLSKAEVISELGALSDREGLTLDKVVVDPDDYLHGRSLYRLGQAHPITDEAAHWYSPAMHGRRAPASELGVASLDGSYAVSGPESGIAALVSWAHDQNIAAVVHAPAGGLGRLLGAVSQSGTGAALIAVALLMVAAVLTWHAVRARARALLMLAGVSTSRLVVQETVRVGGLLLVPAVLVAGAAIAVVAVRSGTGYLTEYVGILAPLFAVLTVGTLLLSLLIGFVAEPSVAFIASRRPPIRRFRVGGELSKFAILATALVCVPLALSSVLSSVNLTQDAQRWVNLRDQLNINNFGAKPGSADEAATDAQFRSVVAAADARSELSLSYTMPELEDESGATETIGDFAAVVIVNPHFLEVMGIGTGALVPVSPTELGDRGEANLGDELALQLADRQAWNPTTFAPFELYRVSEGTELTVVGFDGSPRLQRPRTPLVVLDRAPGTDLSPSFLAAATSRDGVLFGNREHLVADLAAHGLADRATSIDRAADAGLLTLQVATRTMYFNIVAVVLLLGALAFGSWLAATSYVLAHARRLIPMRTGGLSWARIFRARAVSELVIAGALTVATAVTFALLRVPGTLWWGILVPLGFGVLTTVFHLSAGRRVFERRIGRHY